MLEKLMGKDKIDSLATSLEKDSIYSDIVDLSEEVENQIEEYTDSLIELGKIRDKIVEVEGRIDARLTKHYALKGKLEDLMLGDTDGEE